MKKIAITLLFIFLTSLNIIAAEQPASDMLETSKRALKLLAKESKVKKIDYALYLYWENNYRIAKLNLANANDEKISIWKDWNSKLVEYRNKIYKNYQVGLDNELEVHKIDFMIAESNLEISKLKKSSFNSK